MVHSLIIVESPTKVKTLKKFLGSEYDIKASVGHIKDLPKKTLGVDIEKDFKPKYITIQGKSSVIAEIKKAASKVKKIYLAADPDREGEAISWHIANELKEKSDNIYRVLFNEITKRAVTKALDNPSRIDLKKVNAQQARRILDRIVGYQISPLLWKKVRWGLSAGRVQSVAVRVICDREREIRAFKKEEYWTITVDVEGMNPPPFQAKLHKYGGKKPLITSQESAFSIKKELEEAPFKIKEIKKKEAKKSPVAPFITSSLQQEASKIYRFSAKKTMLLAQKLYEGKEIGNEGSVGLITYIRTDSFRIAQEAFEEIKEYIDTNFGKQYLPKKQRIFKKKKNIQDAHEAIRATAIRRVPETIKQYLTEDEYKLYKIIWRRCLASQMADALYDTTTIEIQAGKSMLRAIGSVRKFDGFLKIYEKNNKPDNANKDQNMPPLEEGEILKVNKIDPEQHFTQPPPRYNEASLIKELEEKGIGRPSTYATILSTITSRDYIQKVEKNLIPTELGFLVTDLLVGSFPNIIDVKFTASMEDDLDKVEEGGSDWINVLHSFYGPFHNYLEAADKNMKDVKKQAIATDIICDKCGEPMVIKWGKNGEFLACSKYPDCKNTKEFERTEDGKIKIKEPEQSQQKCDKCGNIMLVKHSRYGSFLGCSAYPKCKNIVPISDNNAMSADNKIKDKPIDKKCKKCGSQMVIKNGHYGRFLSCSEYPKCKFVMPFSTGIACPVEECSGEIVEKKTRKGKNFYGCSNYPKCTFAIWQKPIPQKCPQCGYNFLVEAGKKNPLYKCGNKECDYKIEKETVLT